MRRPKMHERKNIGTHKKKKMRRNRDLPCRLMTTAFAFRKLHQLDAPAYIQIRGTNRKFRCCITIEEEILDPALGDADYTYRCLLQMVMDNIGYERTSSKQLDNYLKPRIHGYLGAFAQSAAPTLNDGECAIVNTTDAPGQHWTAHAAVDGRTIVFDSLGGGDTDPVSTSYDLITVALMFAHGCCYGSKVPRKRCKFNLYA